MDTKVFWTSKVFWAGFVSVVFAILKYFGKLPEGLEEASVTEIIMTIVGVLAIFGRASATGPLTLTKK